MEKIIKSIKCVCQFCYTKGFRYRTKAEIAQSIKDLEMVTKKAYQTGPLKNGYCQQMIREFKTISIEIVFPYRPFATQPDKLFDKGGIFIHVCDKRTGHKLSSFEIMLDAEYWTSTFVQYIEAYCSMLEHWPVEPGTDVLLTLVPIETKMHVRNFIKMSELALPPHERSLEIYFTDIEGLGKAHKRYLDKMYGRYLKRRYHERSNGVFRTPRAVTKAKQRMPRF